MPNRIKRTKARARLRRAMLEVRQIMQDLASDPIDPFLGYGRLCNLYGMIGIHDTVREFFDSVGVNPHDSFSTDDAFKKSIREWAKDWLERTEKIE